MSEEVLHNAFEGYFRDRSEQRRCAVKLDSRSGPKY